MRHVSLFVVVILALAAVALTGCPPIPEKDLGGFWIEGDLSAVVDKVDNDFVAEATKSLEKGGSSWGGIDGLSQEELIKIGDSLKEQSRWIYIYMSPINDDSFVQKGGPMAGYYSFQVEIIDHQFRAHCGGIIPGQYCLSMSFQDEYGNALLCGWKNVLVEGGVSRKENLVVDFIYNYPFQFSVTGMPGTYVTNEWGYGQASLIDTAGNGYYVSWTVGKDDMIFKSFLPLNFAGGVLYVIDSAGNDVYSELPLVIANIDWANFRLSDSILSFPYVPSNAFGGLDIGVEYAWEK